MCICITSVFFIYSAQTYSNGTHWQKQILWISLGYILYVAVSSINYKHFLQYAHVFYALSIIALFLVMTPLGKELYGSRRWIALGSIRLQPTEAAKVGTLILGASILARSNIKTVKDSIWVGIKVCFFFSIPIILIFLQPDLGSTLMFPPMMFSLLYIANLQKRFFAGVFLLFTLLVCILAVDMYKYDKALGESGLTSQEFRGKYQGQSWVPIKDYQRNRILSFIAPAHIDPKGIGINWNRKQSLISVGSGGILGKGWTEGTQAKLGYLPQSVAHNDFIFPVFAEEKGFVGGVILLALYATILFNSIRIAGISRDRFGMLLAVGTSIILFIHIFINIGMAIGLTPITGLPLPFLSYGGSFVLSCFFLLGLVQSVYRFRRDYS